MSRSYLVDNRLYAESVLFTVKSSESGSIRSKAPTVSFESCEHLNDLIGEKFPRRDATFTECAVALEEERINLNRKLTKTGQFRLRRSSGQI